ncbi:glycosyltransferase family 1 protein [soil metagenome]
MKIGIDARFWNETGVGRYIRNLVLELQKQNNQHDFVLYVREQDYAAIKFQITSSQFKIIKTNIHWHSLREQIEFPKLLNEEKLDLMHFTYFSVPVFYKGPYVVTIHDLIIHHFATGEATTLPLPLYKLKVQGYKYIINHAAKNACKIIAVSEATKKEIKDHLNVSGDNILRIYEGVDSQLVNSGNMTNPYGNYFLHVGNVYPHKNAKRLIDAFIRLELEDVKLLFVGKKDYFMKDLEQYARSKFKPEQVKFLGYVEDSQLARLYKNAVATIIPSLMEGFGLPVLEAMANDSLVLASDIPSLKEVAGDAALYFDPLAVADISAKIRHIVESGPSSFNEYRKKGLSKAAEFTWTVMAQKTLTVYESCFSIRQGK